MEKCTKETFHHTDPLKKAVQLGRYDLVRQTGDIILPSVWEHIVCPGDTFTMHMWPVGGTSAHIPSPHVLQPGAPSVKKQSPSNRGEVETTPGLETRAMPPKGSRIEIGKATASIQKNKSQLKEGKTTRDNRKKPTSSTIEAFTPEPGRVLLSVLAGLAWT